MKQFVLYCLLLTLLTSCTHYAIYQSPVHLATSSYKPTPLENEGIPAATYAGIHFAAGGSNHRLHDPSYSFSGTVHRSHNFGSFQASYGGNLMLGNYTVRPFPRPDSVNTFDSRAFIAPDINGRSGNKFFGAWGLSGSINAVTPIGAGGEWRVLGTELSWSSEFGQYQRFRKLLPYSSATVVDRHNSYFTIGVFTEMIGKLADDRSLGYKLALIRSPRKLEDEFTRSSTPAIDFSPTYLSQTLHLTFSNTTLYGQFNFGSYAMNFVTGVSMRLGGKKKAGNSAGL